LASNDAGCGDPDGKEYGMYIAHPAIAAGQQYGMTVKCLPCAMKGKSGLVFGCPGVSFIEYLYLNFLTCVIFLIFYRLIAARRCCFHPQEFRSQNSEDRMTDFKAFLLDSDSWLLNSRLMMSPQWLIISFIVGQLGQLRKLSLYIATFRKLQLL
jgi:hypothetical protein